MDRSTLARRFAALLLMSTCLAGIALRSLASRAGPIRTRPALLGGLLLGGIAMAGHAAHAVDGVWTGPGAEWTTGTNWSSAPTVPDNTATFTNNGAPTSVTISNDASINTMQFSAAAPAYMFSLSNANLVINSGIVNGSSFAPTITNTQEAATSFANGSSAANARIFNNQLGFTQFFNSSSAGTATIVNDGVLVSTNNFGGTTNFNDSSTAANATIFNNNNGQTAFYQASTAGSATLVNSTNGPLDRSMFLAGGTYFFATSSAGNATIINNSGGIAYFGETSSAANATITNNNGGTTYFFEASSAGNATIVNNSGGTVDISGLTTGGTTAGSIAGAGLYQIGSKQLTVGSNNLSTTVSGVIADGGSAGGIGGSLVKVGSGTLTLVGANTFTGGTTLNAGGLVVNGSLASGVTVNGGTLGGSGTIGSLVVNAGTIAPGNSIGTLTVNGNFVQAAGTTYQVEANAQGQGDRITVGGTATLNSATVQVLAQPGNYGARTTYTILRANGGVAGTYSGVSSNFAFLTPSLSYDANDVFLTLSVVQDAFSQGGRTFNQKAVGRVLDQTFPAASGDFATVLSTLVGLGTAQGPQILDAISGQNYAGFSNAMVQGAQLFMSNFANRAGSRSGSGAKVALAEACDVACDTTEPALWGAWGGAVGGTGTIAGNNNAGTFTYSVGGFSGGLDRQIAPNFLAGVTVGYQTGGQWTGGFEGRSVTDTVQAGLYGSFTQGPVYVDALAAYAYNANQLWRPINIPGLQPRTAFGQTAGNQFLGQVEGGYRVDLGGAPGYFVTPFALLQGSVATQSGFTETGAQSLDLSVAQQTTSSLRTIFGAQVGAAMDVGLRDKIAAQLRLGWSHEYSDTARPVTASFVGAPSVPFTVFGAAPTRDGAVIGFSAGTAIAEAMSVYLRYEGNIAGQDSSHALTAGLRVTW
ncbi:MAG TPA: autotransporter domain-containing protein [Reyranella sp.]